MLATLVKRVGKKKHALRYMSGERMGLSMIQSEEVMEAIVGRQATDATIAPVRDSMMSSTVADFADEHEQHYGQTTSYEPALY